MLSPECNRGAVVDRTVLFCCRVNSPPARAEEVEHAKEEGVPFINTIPSLLCCSMQ